MQRKKKSSAVGKAASIYDVAREARVSVFTVSAVVNHKSHVGKKLRDLALKGHAFEIFAIAECALFIGQLILGNLGELRPATGVAKAELQGRLSTLIEA